MSDKFIIYASVAVIAVLAIGLYFLLKKKKVSEVHTTGAVLDINVPKVPKPASMVSIIDEIKIKQNTKTIKLINEMLSFEQKMFNDFDQYLDGQRCESHEQLASLATRLETPVAYVVVAGSFNSGKSAFINSLLRDDICPVRGNPSTSAVTTIRHGKHAIYEILAGSKKKEISLEQYKEMVIHKSGDTDKTTNRRHEFEVYHPADILKHVILVDTPGFNNTKNPYDDKITKTRVTEADVILWLNDINVPLKSTELEILKSEEFVHHRDDNYLILTKADLKSPNARERLLLDAKNKPDVGELFEGILMYSSDDVMTDEGDFENAYHLLLELLIQSGNRATDYVEANVRASLKRHFKSTSLLFERVSEQIPPFKSVLPYVKERTNKLRTMIEERQKEIKTEAKEILKNCFNPVEVSRAEKFYFYIFAKPRAKIIVDTNPTALKRYIDDVFQSDYKRIQALIANIKDRGIVLKVNDILSEKHINDIIEKTAENCKKELRDIKQAFYTGQTKEDYYENLDAANTHLHGANNFFSVLSDFINEILNKFVENSCEAICKNVVPLEDEVKLNHPKTRFNDAMVQRDEIIKVLKKHLKDTKNIEGGSRIILSRPVVAAAMPKKHNTRTNAVK